jgi:DNA polymerase-3 subunit epsilon
VPRSLARTDVLLLDCQSTGANPARGHLLEIAWCRTTASALAGSESDLVDAVTPEEVHKLLDEALAGSGAAVAHFARFERAFVEHLRDGSDALDWICTHEIVCRLLPDLPHRGLKAVAGRFGHTARETKRAADHVRATAVVWREVVQRLETDEGVTTREDLRAWTEATEPSRRVGRGFSMERARRLRLTESPGIYRMLGGNGQILYVGKATSLKRRVNSYFQKRRNMPPRKLEMLLETDLIKRHAPPYNVQLRGRGDGIWFGARDLSDVRTEPDAAHVLGPFNRREPFDAWTALPALVAAQDSPDLSLIVRAAGFPPETPLDPQIGRDGLAEFAAAWELTPDTTTLRRLLGRGARAWKELQEALAAAAEEKAEAQEEEADEEPEDEDEERSRESWAPETPEQVARHLRGSVMHGARLLRRGRFLRQLTECSLVWRPPNRGEEAPWRALRIASGHSARAGRGLRRRDVRPTARAHHGAAPRGGRGRSRRDLPRSPPPPRPRGTRPPAVLGLARWTSARSASCSSPTRISASTSRSGRAWSSAAGAPTSSRATRRRWSRRCAARPTWSCTAATCSSARGSPHRSCSGPWSLCSAWRTAACRCSSCRATTSGRASPSRC